MEKQTFHVEDLRSKDCSEAYAYMRLHGPETVSFHCVLYIAALGNSWRGWESQGMDGLQRGYAFGFLGGVISSGTSSGC